MIANRLLPVNTWHFLHHKKLQKFVLLRNGHSVPEHKNCSISQKAIIAALQLTKNCDILEDLIADYDNCGLLI